MRDQGWYCREKLDASHSWRLQGSSCFNATLAFEGPSFGGVGGNKRTKKQNSYWITNIAEQYLTKISPKQKETPDILVCFCLTKFQKDIQLISKWLGKELYHSFVMISISPLHLNLHQNSFEFWKCLQSKVGLLRYFHAAGRIVPNLDQGLWFIFVRLYLRHRPPWLLGNEGTYDTFFLHFRRVLWYSQALRLYHFYVSIQ